jgi:hypothetical protein
LKVQRATQRRSSYLLNPIVDDYNIRDGDFYRRVKHISAHTDLQSEWIKRFAWLPKRSDITNERIWLTHYYEYVITMDMNGAVPRKSKDWRMIYTYEEYIAKKLSGELKNE